MAFEFLYAIMHNGGSKTLQGHYDQNFFIRGHSITMWTGRGGLGGQFKLHKGSRNKIFTVFPEIVSAETTYSFLKVEVRKVFKGGNYSKEETIDFLVFSI